MVCAVTRGDGGGEDRIRAHKVDPSPRPLAIIGKKEGRRWERLQGLVVGRAEPSDSESL